MAISKLQRTITSRASFDQYPAVEFAPPKRSKTSWGRISGNDAKSLPDVHSEHYVPQDLRTRTYKEHVETIIMQAHHVQELPREETTRDGKGTGFPEPLSEHTNTTLRHPDADTSENATIEGASLKRMNSKTKHRSFLGRGNSRNKAIHGRLSPEESGLYDNIQYEDGTTEQKSLKEISREASKRDSGVHTGASQESLGKVSSNSDAHSEKSQSSSSKKRSILRKLHLEK
ncbi:hypothetical protein GLAREA_04484 [Glarea lozoyensis ATCC 20868]|uniref:Uncharacterized protein n=2 Tax=Glarea lozoyensis TaxID=101852 RepID=S3DMF2_GLAL2|nr:uncharacterized protein GLAREA_04484 [Glarea lozoyensis ATCC 20868]EHL00356.1 hypothetical protein M7I_3638 [Glarea lozoyensis 74030]EPE27693.1 hypothetical protein GLAREA_04484 [Glarea lozoyensis ATCC 20868]